MSEIADRLGVSYKTVQRAVADLKKIADRITLRHVGFVNAGGARGGYRRSAILEPEQLSV